MPRRRLADAIRVLAMDAVQRANSGHPGMPMGMADIAEVLWNDYLRFSPAEPRWWDRDRFVLSNGHGSMLLYSISYLTGYAIDIGELKAFRQLGSRTAGHPEHDPDIGIETTTGPLGQGLANAVGMALAEKTLASTFNRPDHEIVDHYTYVFVGDGCMMEGISHEVCSLAGTLGLGKLVAFYDDNGISIDGPTAGWFTDDTAARFRAYGWHVIDAVDGHDPDAVSAAIEAARGDTARPSLICCKTVIGWGAPNKQGTAATHGEALGEAEVAAARERLGWEHPPFVVPDDVRRAWDARDRGRELEADWQRRLAAYGQAHPDLAAEFSRRMRAELPADWPVHASEIVRTIAAEAREMATRKGSRRSLEGFAPQLPELIGGSADLTGSNNTWHSGSRPVSDSDATGNYVYFGVREFGMAAVMNGLSLHGGFVPYHGTFLVFSDYARNALRMAALIGTRSICVFTHDSIGLGEDGPTHQPVEHTASLRAMPNMHVWRPCDAVETAVAWRAAIERRTGPTSLVLTRQSLPHVERSADQIELISRGAYVLHDCETDPALVLIATGSEVRLAVGAARTLEASGVRVRVVSMPCMEVFEEQAEEYRRRVLPASGVRLAVEAGVADCWWRYVAGRGDVIAMSNFGQSAPGGALFEHYGFTVDTVVETAQRLIQS
ncbi:transketolase [Candidatus Rariloculus sp.]|uniref:transketolase n=1 Tax=Candidatus Rariloculus sp. TaxID=3101265 RepID=UPI003D0CB0DA